MPDWFWAASGILAALLLAASVGAFFDEHSNACLAAVLAVALLYLNSWIWSHLA